MKTMEVQEARWACRTVRSARAIFGDGFGAGHVEHCAGCQAYFRAGSQLDQQLRQGAVSARAAAPVPVELDRRISRAIRLETQPAALRRSRGDEERPRWSVMPLAGVAAAVALLALLAFPSSPETKTTSGMTTAVSARTVSAQDLAELMPTAETLKKNPLQDEVELVYSDAQSALEFLALNFLPAGVRRSE